MINYYACTELHDNNTHLWSIREDTAEQLVIVLIDENKKNFIIDNVDFVDRETQTYITKKLGENNYTQGYTIDITKFLGE